MSQLTPKMREIAKELLSQGEVKLVIGWEKGTFWYNSTPAFIDSPEEAERLVWDDFCVNNLATYLMDYIRMEGKVALFVKGCDSRGVNRLIQDNVIPREKLVLIGIPCSGMRDLSQVGSLTQDKAQEVPLLAKCQECRFPNPLVYDRILGEPVEARSGENRFAAVEAVEAMETDGRYEFWSKEFNRCIRCYACRNTCPACNCKENTCIFDSDKSGWVNKAASPSDNSFFHITRAMHVAGRCVECGECERVCPMNIPLMTINKKILKEINEFFGPYDAGLDLETNPPLGQYKTEDPEKFL